MFERKHEKLAPVSVFVRRMAASGLDWVDSLLEASMILGGMGPANPLKTSGAKIFASGYALFCGLIFIAVMGIILAPITHRMLHKFHMEEEDQKK